MSDFIGNYFNTTLFFNSLPITTFLLSAIMSFSQSSSTLATDINEFLSSLRVKSERLSCLPNLSITDEADSSAIKCCQPHSPWDVPPGLYSRHDGSVIRICGRDQFWGRQSMEGLKDDLMEVERASMECHTGKSQQARNYQ